MTREKASLKGKGSAILLGEETAEESVPEPVPEVPASEEDGEVDWSAMLEDEASAAEPLPEEEAPAVLPSIEHYYSEDLGETEPEPQPQPVAEVETPPGEVEEFPPEADVDWSAMLEDEITTAEPLEGEEAAPSVPDIEYQYPEEEPAMPGSELLDIEETAMAEPSPTPVSPAAPVTPAPAEPQPAAETQPPESPVADHPPAVIQPSAPRIRVGGLLAGVSLTDAEAPSLPGPRFEEVKVLAIDRPLPRALSPEEEEIVIRRVSQRHRRELFDRVSKLYREVPKKLSASSQESMRADALLLLSESRDIVLEDPRQFDEAEYKVAQVEAIIAHAQDVEKWSHYYGNRLIAYLVTWFAVLMAGIMFIGPLSAWLEELTSRAGTTSHAPTVIAGSILFTMLWGGIGGVVGGLYALWRHIAVFDKQYTTWYTLQPISGLVLGGIVHVVIMAGFLSMSVQAGGTGGITAQEGQAVQWFPAILAVVFGFRQNSFYALLDRIIELIGQPQEDSNQSGGRA